MNTYYFWSTLNSSWVSFPWPRSNMTKLTFSVKSPLKPTLTRRHWGQVWVTTTSYNWAWSSYCPTYLKQRSTAVCSSISDRYRIQQPPPGLPEAVRASSCYPFVDRSSISFFKTKSQLLLIYAGRGPLDCLQCFNVLVLNFVRIPKDRAVLGWYGK